MIRAACIIAIVLLYPGLYYGPDVTASTLYIESGHYSTSVGSYAFNNLVNSWASLETGANVSGTSWIGQDFGLNSYEIRRVGVIQHGLDSNSITSYSLDYSDNCTDWLSAGSASLTYTVIEQYAVFESAGSHRCWRLRALTGTTAGNWYVGEIEMFQWVSDDTPTPGYVAVSTLASSGSQYAVMRSASFGEMAIVAAIAVVCLIALAHFVRTWIYARRVD